MNDFTKKGYSSISSPNSLASEEMFSLKGGFLATGYGCESYVCAIARSGAKDLCTDAYCRSKVGPESSEDGLDPDYNL